MIIGARSYPRGTRLGLHVHREAQLLFASSGVMQVTTPKGRWLVPPARAVWLPPGIEHAVDMLADIEMRALLIPADQLAQHPQASRLAAEFVATVGPLLRETILAAFKADSYPRRIALLVELALFELVEDEDAATFMPMPNDARARRVADMILADPANDSELELLAHSAGASARTITRLFPAETNLTFKEWRQRARIMAAVEALGNGQASIKQLALQLGFSSVAAFGHAFRQIMGMTPSELMRRSGSELR
ncbi:HTH-type transcriptional repressor of iron proteins A [compost metagenome]